MTIRAGRVDRWPLLRDRFCPIVQVDVSYVGAQFHYTYLFCHEGQSNVLGESHPGHVSGFNSRDIPGLRTGLLA
jgi:hypothetical protein